MLLEIDANGWVAIIGALGTAATVIAGAAVLVIAALGNMNKKMDAAATRREQIGTAIIDPAQSVLPPKEQP